MTCQYWIDMSDGLPAFATIEGCNCAELHEKLEAAQEALRNIACRGERYGWSSAVARQLAEEALQKLGVEG